MTSPQLQSLNNAIAECLAAWSNVEIEISHLFMVLQERPWNEFDHPLRVAFESVISLETRLTMIRASVAVDDRYRDDYAPHYNALYNKIMKSYKKRHEVAHFLPISQQGPNGKEYAIKPFFNWNDYQNESGRPTLNELQILERKSSFYHLCHRIKQHRQHVGKLRGLPASYFAQAGDLVHPPLGQAFQTPEEP